MNKETFTFMENYFDEVEPLEFYRAIFKRGYLAAGEDAAATVPPRHGTIMNLEEAGRLSYNRFLKVWDNLEGIEEAIKAGYPAAVAPVSYVGYRRVNNNARDLFSLAIDLDNLKAGGIGNLFSQIERAEVLPRPSFIVCSGNGLHLYYNFEKPIPCYEYNLWLLQRFKTELTRRLWNRYITAKYRTPEYESLLQTFRVVGSKTKDGRGIVRAFDTSTTATGQFVTLDYLDSFVPEKFRIRQLERRDNMPLEFWKLANPSWYNERVTEKKDRKYWTCNRGLYDKWLQRIKSESTIGHRYFCVMALAIYAIKSGVPFEELEKDALALVPAFDEMTTTADNHFTVDDVRSALRAYSEKYKTFPRAWIEKLCAISIPENRRNGRKRREHLELARLAQEQRHRKNGTKWNGRKSKESIVIEWQRENPEGTKKQCREETGLSYPTIRKYWKGEAARVAPLPASDLSTYEDITEYIQALDMIERAEYIAKNVSSFSDSFKEHYKKLDKEQREAAAIEFKKTMDETAETLKKEGEILEQLLRS